MRLIVSGGRHFNDRDFICNELNQINRVAPISVLIHGGLPTIGGVSELWARENDVNVIRYPANWALLGKHAETKRNAFMLEDSRPEAVLLFPGGKETAFFRRAAKERSIPLISPAHPLNQAMWSDGPGDEASRTSDNRSIDFPMSASLVA